MNLVVSGAVERYTGKLLDGEGGDGEGAADGLSKEEVEMRRRSSGSVKVRRFKQLIIKGDMVVTIRCANKGRAG